MEIGELYTRLYAKILNFIAHKPRTEYEVRAKLSQLFRKYEDVDELDKEVIEAKLFDELRAEKYIDDSAYVKQFLSIQVDGMRKSSSALAAFLIKKGVSKELINKHLSTVDKTYNKELLLKLATKKLSSLAGLPPLKKKMRLISFLRSKRFSSGLIFDAVDTLLGVK